MMEQKMTMVIRTVENSSSLLCHGPTPTVDGEVPDGFTSNDGKLKTEKRTFTVLPGI